MLNQGCVTLNINNANLFRFVSWFSYHLSNFQFRWSWEDWEEELVQLDQEHPKPKFIKEVLLKCLRLAYHQRVKDIVPESFIALVPEKPEPIFQYENEDAAKTEESMEQENGNSVAKSVSIKLQNAIKQKASQDEILEVLKEIPDEDGEQQTNPLRVIISQ